MLTCLWDFDKQVVFWAQRTSLTAAFDASLVEPAASVLKSRQRFLLRVWDKVISGSCKILVFVALEILLSYKIVLLGMSRPEGVVRFLCNVSKRRKRSSRVNRQSSRWLSPSDAAGEHGRHREQSHRPVAQILRYSRPRRVALQSCPPMMHQDWHQLTNCCESTKKGNKSWTFLNKFPF